MTKYIKSTEKIMINVYIKLFSIVLNTGLVPEDWIKGMIVPLFKKGECNNINNYHGITILSCLGKRFMAVTNCRLTKNVKSLGTIGFRNGYSAMDHIFTFNMLLDLYIGKKNKMYVAFIDCRKAFHSIDRISL